MGHSAGAEFATRACQLDAGLKACVDLDGGMVPIAALPEYPDAATLQQPLLLLEPYYRNPKWPGRRKRLTAYFKKKEAQLQATGPEATMWYCERRASPTLRSLTLRCSLLGDGYPPTDIVLHNLELIETYVREFLDKNFKQETAPLLDGGNATIPEAGVKRYGR